ncbi:hypothetical protein [Paracoccus sp. JM45]|uniref:hypothetical protein n=1 Tax=Paracoccus sp. JM45 TaxID=2283626 RepID=UPI001C727E86|nr:hypothetical protein [Paracoccus sp. JM45]
MISAHFVIEIPSIRTGILAIQWFCHLRMPAYAKKALFSIAEVHRIFRKARAIGFCDQCGRPALDNRQVTLEKTGVAAISGNTGQAGPAMDATADCSG